MLHNDDVVEEVTTGRPGKIDSIQSGGALGEEPKPNQWRVHFSDGKDPLMKYFDSEDHLRLIKCPHGESSSGFVPSRPIMDPPF